MTGYGEDAPWQSPQMNLLVIVLQLVGIGFLLSAVDVFVVPWLQEALRPPGRPPPCRPAQGTFSSTGTPRGSRSSSRRWRSRARSTH